MVLLELFNNTLLNGLSHKIVTSSKNMYSPGFQDAPLSSTLTVRNEYCRWLNHSPSLPPVL